MRNKPWETGAFLVPKNVAQTFHAGKIIEICRPTKMWPRNSLTRKLLRFASLGRGLSEPLRADFRAFWLLAKDEPRKIEKSKIDRLKSRKSKMAGRADHLHKGKNINHKTIGEIKDFIKTRNNGEPIFRFFFILPRSSRKRKHISRPHSFRQVAPRTYGSSRYPGPHTHI